MVYNRLVFILIFFTSCKTWYINDAGEVRPKKQEYVIKPDNVELSSFDSIPFEIMHVFANQFENFDGSVNEFITIFSSDCRVCAFVDTSNFIGNKLVLIKNIWQECPSVGFYQKKNDSIYLEYYLQIGLGKYIEEHCYIDEDGNLVVFKSLTGKGKSKWNNKNITIYRRVDWIQL